MGRESSYVMLLELGECKKTFNLEKAVCNHGFFMMAPNRWNPSDKTFRRPLRLADGVTSVNVIIVHSSIHNPHLLYIHVNQCPSEGLSSLDRQVLLKQVSRMLKISERDERDVREFQKVHPQAKERGFGRLFRSPSLFEDAAKSILLSNCTWSRTLEMAEHLCKLQHEMAKNNGRPRNTSSTSGRLKRKKAGSHEPILSNNDDALLVAKIGNFPSAKEIASFDRNYFVKNHKSVLGYRAQYIIDLAKDIESGNLGLEELEEKADSENYGELKKKIMKIKGVGSFICANIMMCIRYYNKVPVDTETTRHLLQVHGRKKCDAKTTARDVEIIYDKYAPFQCLAYWMEMTEYYENNFGRLSELPASSYAMISGSRL